MAVFATFTEVRFTDDPDLEIAPRQSPFDVIEHPYRVIVHDSEFHLLAIGTAAVGPPRDVLVNARTFATNVIGYAFALILDRAGMSVASTIAKNTESQRASTHSYSNPQQPDATGGAVPWDDGPACGGD